MGKILITGATGTNGKALIAALTKLNADFVIATRNVEEAKKKIKTDRSFVPFSFDQPDTFENAVQDIDRVFLLGPPLVLGLDVLLSPFIDFLHAKGIKRVVYFSALKSDAMGDTLHFHGDLERKLIDDGFDYTILRPAFFSQNFKNYEWDNIMDRGIVFMPAGSGKAGFIDAEDIGAVAAKVLTEEGHSGKIYELTGPDLLSYTDAADILSSVMQKDVIYPNPTPETFKQVLLGADAPEFVADYLINVYSAIANEEVAFLTPTVATLLGRQPHSLRSVLERDFHV